jgi:integrase
MRNVRPATAKAYISALRSLHLRNNHDTSAFDDPRVSLILEGGKKVFGEGTRRIRLPLTSDILARIIPRVSNDKDGLNLKAALCVAFAGFLRSGEFTWETWGPSSSRSHLARKHVKFNKNGSITLTLPTSKTDPYRRGTNIQLSQAISILCPVRALSTLLRAQPKQPDDPLFSLADGPFNRSFLIGKIKELLLRAGIDASNFSGHSLRKGAAVSAAACGISKEEIKLLGRWKSDAVDVYINELAEEDQITKLLKLNARLHSHNPN